MCLEPFSGSSVFGYIWGFGFLACWVFLRALSTNGKNAAETRDLLSQLNRSFASLSQPEQEVAQKIINDILNGELKIEAGEAGESRRSLLDLALDP